MTKNTFKKRFDKAYKESIVFTKKLVIDKLPNNYLFNIYMNLYENNKRVEKYLRLNFDEAVDKLYRDDGMPKWIDISVCKVDGEYTILRCDYSADFITDDSKLQFSEEVLSPFKFSGPGFHDLKKLEKIKKGEKVLLDNFDEERG